MGDLQQVPSERSAVWGGTLNFLWCRHDQGRASAESLIIQKVQDQKAVGVSNLFAFIAWIV
jgi:hypothetical protein